MKTLLISVVVYAALGFATYAALCTPLIAAVLGAAWTMGMFLGTILLTLRASGESRRPLLWAVLADDRLYAGLLASLAIFMMYYFF